RRRAHKRLAIAPAFLYHARSFAGRALPRMPCRRFANRAAGLLGRMLVAVAIAGAVPPAKAGPFLPAGDAALRADIELLADYGILEGPVTTWPLAWGPILDDLEDAGAVADLPPGAARALERVRAAALREA